MAARFPQHHLLKRRLFLLWIASSPSLKIIWWDVCGAISGFSVFWCHMHVYLSTNAPSWWLSLVLKSGRVISPTSFFYSLDLCWLCWLGGAGGPATAPHKTFAPQWGGSLITNKPSWKFWFGLFCYQPSTGYCSCPVTPGQAGSSGSALGLLRPHTGGGVVSLWSRWVRVEV